jgi:exopolysaccharide biosynthesis protein
VKRYFLFFLSASAALILFPSTVNAQIDGFNQIKWERERIAPGLIWKSSHTVLNDSVPQNINVLLVNLHKRRISILYNPAGNSPVSRQAASVNALAAINGGFFNIKNGGSVTYLKTGGNIADSDTSKKWQRNVNMNGAVFVKQGKELYIDKAVQNGWFDSMTGFEDILVTGPLLVKNDSLTVLPGTSLVINKHPRTAIGLRNKRKVVLMTLDGRTGEAIGVTLNELADFMVLLRCRDAVNLDGGGSSTMWINGKPFNGVVNMPCDNKKFDHEGERAVSDILIIR